jgi:hypothetical protein
MLDDINDSSKIAQELLKDRRYLKDSSKIEDSSKIAQR